MPSTYALHEPAPHHPSPMAFGRGGAGNRTRPLPPTNITTTTHKLPSDPHRTHATPNFSTGRGGAGNMHDGTHERRIFSFDEELAKQTTHAVPVYHIGRGGQGNAVTQRRDSDAGSWSSSGSEKRGSLEWVKSLGRKV